MAARLGAVRRVDVSRARADGRNRGSDPASAVGSQLIILAALVVLVAASACLVDSDATGSGGLCGSFLAIPIGPPLTVTRAIARYVRPAVTSDYAVSAEDVPVPPPRS